MTDGRILRHQAEKLLSHFWCDSEQGLNWAGWAGYNGPTLPHVGVVTVHRFGLRLRELRQECGWRQKEVEQMLNLRPGVVSQYERGLREPGFDLLLAFADLFGISTDYLLGRPGASRAWEPPPRA